MILSRVIKIFIIFYTTSHFSEKKIFLYFRKNYNIKKIIINEKKVAKEKL